METHLYYDTLYQYQGGVYPAHICLPTDAYLPMRVDCIESLYFRCVFFKNGMHYTEWSKLKFTVISREIKFKDVLKNADFDELFTGLVVMTIPIPIVDFHFDIDSVILKLVYPQLVHREIVLRLYDLICIRPSSDRPSEVSAKNIGIDFYQLTSQGNRQTPDEEKRCLFFQQGPLEPPSTVRGLKATGNAKPMQIPAHVNEKMTESFLSDSWFEQNVRCKKILDFTQTYRVVVCWYELSFSREMQIENNLLSASQLKRVNAADFWDRTDRYLRDIGSRVLTHIVKTLQIHNRQFKQKFNCNFPVNFSFEHLLSFMQLGKDFWILNLTLDSCIIKAIICFLGFRNGRKSFLAQDEVWGDLIDCSKGSVIYGEKIQWILDSTNNLYSTRREKQNKSWELYVDCCALYVSEKLELDFVLPGGFAITGKFAITDGDIDFFNWRFGLS
uniref:Uncharacterized protein n=1 Tax=Human betaherpesvirus 6 TaxID=10368 RepID=A0A5P9SAV3_9BETA|nr:hypothetical protein [Human betaherpesvirus 6]